MSQALWRSLSGCSAENRLGAFGTRVVPEYVISEVHQRVGQPLADARGSDRSRDGYGAVGFEYET